MDPAFIYITDERLWSETKVHSDRLSGGRDGDRDLVCCRGIGQRLGSKVVNVLVAAKAHHARCVRSTGGNRFINTQTRCRT